MAHDLGYIFMWCCKKNITNKTCYVHLHGHRGAYISINMHDVLKVGIYNLTIIHYVGELYM